MKMLLKRVKFAGDNRFYPADKLSEVLCKIKKSPCLNDKDINLLKSVKIEIVEQE